MANKINKTITFPRGDTYAFKVIIEQLDTSLDITDVIMTVKNIYKQDEPVLQKRLGEGITFLQKFRYMVSIPSIDTENMKTGVPYVYDIIIKLGDTKKTIVEGRFELTPNVTMKINE